MREKVNYDEVLLVLRQTSLFGIHSEDYQKGFWDCYTLISKNLENHFKALYNLQQNERTHIKVNSPS